MSEWEEDRGSSHYRQQTLDAEQRGSRGGGDFGRKPPRRYDHQNTIDIRMDCVGRIIGRGGSNIKRLESDFNVRVELDKNNGTATVSGNNESDVKEAIDQIKSKMADTDSRGEGGGGSGGGRDSYSRRNNDYDGSRRNNDYDNQGSSRSGGGSRHYSSSYDNESNNKYGRSSSTKEDAY